MTECYGAKKGFPQPPPAGVGAEPPNIGERESRKFCEGVI